MYTLALGHAYNALKKSVKSLKSIAMSAIQTQSNRLAAKMVTCNINSLYKQKLIEQSNSHVFCCVVSLGVLVVLLTHNRFDCGTS